jgi:hypothetical protein
MLQKCVLALAKPVWLKAKGQSEASEAKVRLVCEKKKVA